MRTLDANIPFAANTRRLLLAALAALTLGACKGIPDEVAMCEATSDGGTACEMEDPPPIEPECAEPEFDTSHPPSTEYECEGQAGGAIVFNQVEVVVFGEVRGGGQGAISSETTPFPSQDHDVTACCYGSPVLEDVEGSPCLYDCGRAAINETLERLRVRAAQDDPSDPDLEDEEPGACNAAPMKFGGAEGCRDNLRLSLESWIAQIEAHYQECVEAATASNDPNLDFDNHDVAFDASKKFVFEDPECDHETLGCLWGAEFRPFCQIADATAVAMSSCEQAGNVPDPAADGDGGLDDTSGGGGGVVDPFGDIDNSVYCSPQTDCTILPQLHYDVGYNFFVFYDEGIELQFVTLPTRGFKITGLDNGEYSKELADAFGIQNNDVITHVNGTQLANKANTLAVIAMLDDDDSPWSVTVRRQTGFTWATLNYSIEFAVSSPLKRGDDSPDVVAPQEGEPSSTSACACQLKGTSPAPAGLAALLFGGLLGRRRRRV